MKPGDKIKIVGEEFTIETFWGQGKHRAFKMTDGTIHLDIHKRDDVELVSTPTPKAVDFGKWERDGDKD